MASDAARLYRIILPVSRIDEVASFYAGLLQQPGRRVSAGRHYFDCGGVVLALFDPQADGDRRQARPNSEHIYFAVSDLEALYDRARELKCLSAEMGAIERRPWGEVSFYAQDPFGNPLCFVDASTLFTG